MLQTVNLRFVGPSGCGKSTLLRMIAGLETVTSGGVAINGTDVTNTDPADRGCRYFSLCAVSAHERLKTWPLREDEPLTRQKLTGACARLRTFCLMLSWNASQGPFRWPAPAGSNRQSIVRELGTFPFDEPLSNLDAELRVQMRLEIAKLHRDLGSTMIYVTHDQVEAMTPASRIVISRRVDCTGWATKAARGPRQYVCGRVYRIAA